MMKADISIVQSKKGTEIMVSGNKINKYGMLKHFIILRKQRSTLYVICHCGI